MSAALLGKFDGMRLAQISNSLRLQAKRSDLKRDPTNCREVK